MPHVWGACGGQSLIFHVFLYLTIYFIACIYLCMWFYVQHVIPVPMHVQVPLHVEAHSSRCVSSITTHITGIRL